VIYVTVGNSGGAARLSAEQLDQTVNSDLVDTGFGASLRFELLNVWRVAAAVLTRIVRSRCSPKRSAR